MSFLRILQLFILVECWSLSNQQVYNCPDPWITFEGSCYNFVFYPAKHYVHAKLTCMMDGAALVSINKLSEHNFVSQWLMSNDPAINTWYTSGVIDEETLKMQWEGDGTNIEPGLRFWLNDEHRDKRGDHIVYTYGVYDFMWSREYARDKLPYICEISQTEAYKIVKEDRDFDFGSNYSDPLLAPKGPKFVLHQQSLVVVRTSTKVSASIEYEATGIPIPSYKIIHTDYQGNTTEITPTTDLRYTITSGKLTIDGPREMEDAGIYYCIAQNEYGLVMSNPMTLSFGFLGEFSNVDPAPVIVNNHESAVIDCSPTPLHRPAISYQWFKGDYHFIRPDLHPYIFVSRNGKMYFSVVSDNDAGNYRCLVKLTANIGASIGTNQPPSRISRPIPLVIKNSAATVFGPNIAADFIAVSPKNPIRGQTVYLECLAYGTMPLTYHWTRQGLPIPPKATVEDHNRILVIPNAQVEDGGSYTCQVSRQNTYSDIKSHFLFIAAEPFFLFNLKDQHIDQGSQLTWHCAARGIPSPEYFWLKNGIQLKTEQGLITVNNNVLVIHNADPVRHNGMYQCGARNAYGTSYTTGQLRVLGFAPTFAKRPVEGIVYGAIAGNVTFTCHPDAAPHPVFKWLKDGAELNLIPGDTTSRIRMLVNGNLLITQVNSNDVGYYTCRAENIFGTGSSSGRLVTTSRTVINVQPRPVTVKLNETGFLRCEASASPTIDLVYGWMLNGQQIDVEKDPHYVLGTTQSTLGLFVRMSQHKHAGYYECLAKTPMETARAGATLTVTGPPGEIGYVYIESGTITSTSARLGWTVGPQYGLPILYYTIEASHDPFTNWTAIIPRLPDTDVTVSIEDNTRRLYMLTDLKAFSAYKFRITAANVYGIGPTSRPSTIYQTNMAKPHKAPDNVGGGGGWVTDLTITWDPLPPDDHGGPGLGYHIYWRLKGTERWSKVSVHKNTGQYVTQVPSTNFYMEYNVMVGAFNSLGSGPNSTIVTIYSAEDLPIVTVTGVSSYRYNATAIMVMWAPINNTREVMRGKIMGYQVNYWERFDPNPIVNAISWRTLDTYGLIIGLLPDTWYAFDVQVFNTAGLNSRGDTYFQRTRLSAPLLYPTEVTVSSHGSSSVFVSWRGVSISSIEESLTGYKIKYWLQGDDITQAIEKTTYRETEAIINGIDKGKLYQLRLCATSRGGDGNMGNTVYFTLGGQISIDPTVSEIRAGAAILKPLLFDLVLLSVFVSVTI